MRRLRARSQTIVCLDRIGSLGSPTRAGAIALATVALSACAQVIETPPILPARFGNTPISGGRTQVVAVNPFNQNELIIATQFGGLWHTTNGGRRWRHVDGLPTVLASDVQYGGSASTIVATLAEDTRVVNGAGIYVSGDGGTTWSRPLSGSIPRDARTPDRGSAWGIAVAPDNDALWYVGTSYGIARSTNFARSWTHVKVDTTQAVNGAKRQDAVNAVVAIRDGVVLAMLDEGIYRSDDAGRTWMRVRSGNFSAFHHYTGVNKLERSRDGTKVFVAISYDSLGRYDVASSRWTTTPLPSFSPEVDSRGPMVRVSALPSSLRALAGGLNTDDLTLLWVSLGEVLAVTVVADTTDIASLQPDDWTLVGRLEGIHDDIGDLGVAGPPGVPGEPVMVGSDGGVFRATGDVMRWTSGAPRGSRLNSLQITDIAAMEVGLVGGSSATDVYFTTQDNSIWGSTDGGVTFPQYDCTEGFHLDLPPQVAPGDSLSVSYGGLSCTAGSSRVASRGLSTPRAASDTTTRGAVISNFAQPVFLANARWLRLRWATLDDDDAVIAPAELYVSTDNGHRWRSRFALNIPWMGIAQRTNTHLGDANVSVYLPVTAQVDNPRGLGPRIGLVRLNNLFAARSDTIGASDMLLLPDSGSLGQRATEFDWQAVFGVHPHDARYLIAPDIVNGVVKVSRDGGATWSTDAALTNAVSQSGQLRLGDHQYRMQVTHIAYDPRDDRRILVGTRDAGVVCTRDGGYSWRTIPNTDGIRYVTGFVFRSSGTVMVSTYGRGLWTLGRDAAACTSGIEWPPERPTLPGDPTDPLGGQSRIPRLPGLGQDPGASTPPTGRDLPGHPIVMLSTTAGGAGLPVIGTDREVQLVARGFEPGGSAPTVSLDGAALQLQRGFVESSGGVFALRLRVPVTLPNGVHQLELRQASSGLAGRVLFLKTQLDERDADEQQERPSNESKLGERLRKVLAGRS